MAHEIVKIPDLLEEAHVPLIVFHREQHTAELENCLKPALSMNKPIHAWLFGQPGTGKTLVSKFILRKLSKDGRLGGIYINCWEHNTYYAVLDELVRKLRILGAEKLNTSFKLERLRQFVGTRSFIIILDEIDQPKRQERDSIIYNLCNVGNVGLVIISNSRDMLFSMDERIRSRMNAKQIEFSGYTVEDLASILRLRAESALSARTWNDEMLGKIASFAEGDARRAFQTLKNAARWAESENSAAIAEKHVQAGLNSSRGSKKAWLLERLSSHHRLLYDLVKEHGQINSGELWEAYLDDCRELNKPPIALRTFSEYMNKLIELDLVRWDRALVRGKVRVFRVSG